MRIIEIMSNLNHVYNCIDYEIHIVDKINITYNDFFEKCLLKNKPCIIKNVANTWNCTSKWIENETINYEYFIKKYGDLEAPVADCKVTNFNAHCKIDMKVRDYMIYLQNPVRDELLYLKDWHLQKLRASHGFYEVPDIFASDWLNEFAIDRHEDDFMFVYIGPQNSWTPLHVDVYYSYSWSVNIIGRKKWVLFPPGEEKKLKDKFGNLPLSFSSEKYPDVKYIEVVQERGDAIFVPSGWHHEVFNSLDTISINHNWVNACNIEAVWTSLQQCLLSIENEIAELKDTNEFQSHCQIMLKSLFGMSYIDFVKFVYYIGNKRLHQLGTGNKTVFHNYELGYNHVVFDLKAVLKVINLIRDHHLSNVILPEDDKCNITSMKHRIENFILTIPTFIN